MAAADADGPDYWAVRNVPKGSHLNLRKGPAILFQVLAKIPSDFSHLENLGCTPAFTDKEWFAFSEQEREIAASFRWCRVRYKEQVGWVAGVYLKEGFAQKGSEN